MRANNSIKWLCAAITSACLTAGAYADVILEIDLSVPNQITINATSGLSAATVSGSDTIGVYFENFYGGGGSALAETLIAGDLTNAENPADFSPSLFRGGGGSDPGLNLWSWSTDSAVTFTAGLLAFTGSATWALSATEYAEMLAGNPSGNVFFPADTFDDVGGATLIGTYQVIPEPASLSLLGLGLAFGLRRNRG